MAHNRPNSYGESANSRERLTENKATEQNKTIKKILNTKRCGRPRKKKKKWKHLSKKELWIVCGMVCGRRRKSIRVYGSGHKTFPMRNKRRLNDALSLPFVPTDGFAAWVSYARRYFSISFALTGISTVNESRWVCFSLSQFKERMFPGRARKKKKKNNENFDEICFSSRILFSTEKRRGI